MNGNGRSTYLRFIVLVGIAPLFALLGCGDSGPAEVIPPAPPVPTSVTIVPAAAKLAALGQTVQLNTTILDQNGQPIPGVNVTWTTSDESVATVDATGLVTATGNGTTSITAAVTGTSVSGSAEVTVEQQPREIALSPQRQSFRALGDTVRLMARVLDANGHVVDGAIVDWASSDPSVVSVDDSGLVTAVGEGNASVLVTSGPAEGSADFSVEQQVAIVRLFPKPDTLRALGSTFQLTATGLDANGHATGATGFVWTSTDVSVATVNDAGLITAVENGSTDVTAALPDERVSASVGITVAQQAETVRFVGTVDTLDVGAQHQLAAEAHDGNRHLVAHAIFEWSSGDESVATVDPNGLVSTRNTGSVEITVTVVGSDAVATITLLVRDRERDILVEFYNATDGPNWERDLNWLTEFPLNVWDGVTTDYRDRLVVTGLYLHNNNLRGKMPTELGGLANLEFLNLSFNNLTGSIPPALGNLARLTSLELNSNDLTGPIPPELGSLDALEYLWLEVNDLTGPIPPELGDLVNAVAIDLRLNGLAGSIPPELGNLARVRILRLGDNELTGSIPLELTKLRSLESLDLGENNLTGSISELGNLTSLRSLHLNNNHLTGSIPPELGNLEELGRPICYARPPLGVCTRSGLQLGGNDLTGPIPPELGNLGSLYWLSLSGNDLTGPIPPELGNLGSLTRLDLSDNDLTEAIPSEFANLDSLQVLLLSANRLTGSIPPELGNLSNLTWLALTLNGLTGSIPSELGRLGKLRILSLSANDLTGQLPPELGELDQLKVLQVDGNRLTGAIPLEFISLELDEFRWNDSELCAPANQVFQTWLRSIPNHHGGAMCPSGGGA